MNLRHLKYFLVLSEELHFRKASERLFIAQPPLSRQIKEFEEELGVKLFNRTKRKVTLTECGAFLRDETYKLFSQIDFVNKQVKDIHNGNIGNLKIGYVGAAMHSILPEILKTWRDLIPSVRTSLFEYNNEEQLDALEKNQIDIGFVRSSHIFEGMQVFPVFTETFSVIYPAEYQISDIPHFDLMLFKNYPFISFPRSCAPEMVDKIFKICVDSGFNPNVAHETSQINSIVRLVESGLGYSIVPSTITKSYQLNIKSKELTQTDEKADLYMIHKQNPRPLVEQAVDLYNTKMQIKKQQLSG